MSDLKRLIERLNRPSRGALEGAARRAVAQTNHAVEIEHLLLELMDIPDGDLPALFRHFDIERAALAAQLTQVIESFARGAGRTPSFAPQLPEWLRQAWVVSSVQFGLTAVRSGTLLLALLDNPGLGGTVLERLPALAGLDPRRLAADLPGVFDHSLEAEGRDGGAPAAERATGGPAAAENSALEAYTIDMIALGRAGRIDPVIGRASEIAQLTDVLMRRRQNNPALVGEPGVGKTAIVEGLALRIARGQVPEPLREVGLRQLDVGLLQAGAGVRGEFEKRLKQLLAEIAKAPRPIILFIDEVHTLIGSGGAEGLGDAANLLKPALARGEVRVIGATTWREYKKYVEKDAALARRFQAVRVDEPSIEETETMLRGLAADLEKHHRVRIENAAIAAAARLSARYITGRQLPDKAVSVLDTACARVALSQASEPPALSSLIRDVQMATAERARLSLEMRFGADHADRLSALGHRLDRLETDRAALQDRADREQALIAEIRRLEAGLAADPPAADCSTSQLVEARARLQAAQQPDGLRLAHVDVDAVAGVIANWTGIPVDQLLKGSLAAARDLEARLKERVVGQDHAVAEIARRIQAASVRLTDPDRPMGVFLLVGPTGTGKTETALALAELMFGSRDHLVSINMTEYQEAHTVAGLKGAPPGYVGYGTGGVLTEAVRRTPYTVVLLDEFEKAHPDVLELFYQIFDAGRLEDAEGQKIDFRNTLILATTNAGDGIVEALAPPEAEQRPDPAQIAEALEETLRRQFRAALLGRMTVIPYLTLTPSDMEQVVRLKLDRLARRIEEAHQAPTLVTDAAVSAIRVAAAREPGAGARALDRVINAEILPMLSTLILDALAEGRPVPGLVIDADEDGLFADLAPSAAPDRRTEAPAA